MPMRLSRRAALATLVALSACESPEAPPPPDDALLPPREAASGCGPVGTPLFPQVTFRPNGYMADLEEGGSCGIYLEQDECIVAIFRDCTYPSGRQWIGTANTNTNEVRLSISPTYDPAPPLAPPHKCTGAFVNPNGPRASAMLTCEGGVAVRGLYLEKRDLNAKPFAEQLDMEQWSVSSFQTIDAIPAATTVRTANGTETWVAVNWTGGGAGGGVWRHAGAVTAPRITIVDDESNVYAIDASPNGKVITAQGKTSHTLRLYDAETRMRVATATIPNVVRALAATSSSTFLVATASTAYVFRHDAGSDRLTRLPFTFRPSPGHEITAAEWSYHAGPGSAPFVIAAAQGDDGELIGLGDDLSVRWRTQRKPNFDVRTMEVLPGKDRVGLILWGGSRDFEGPDQANQYYEVRPANGMVDDVIPIPFFDSIYSMAYDPVRDRVYLANRYGGLVFIDRLARRADQSFLRVREPESRDAVTINAITWDETRQRLYVVDPKRGVVDAFRILQ